MPGARCVTFTAWATTYSSSPLTEFPLSTMYWVPAFRKKAGCFRNLTLFWLDFLKDTVSNHLITAKVEEYPAELQKYADQLRGRSMLVQKAQMVEIECVARGYLSGSGWKEYQQTGAVCGIKLPAGLRESDKLPEPIFTPATKADQRSRRKHLLRGDGEAHRQGTGRTAARSHDQDLYRRRLITLPARASSSRTLNSNSAIPAEAWFWRMRYLHRILPASGRRINISPGKRRNLSINSMFVIIWSQSSGTSSLRRLPCQTMWPTRPVRSTYRLTRFWRGVICRLASAEIE